MAGVKACWRCGADGALLCDPCADAVLAEQHAAQGVPVEVDAATADELVEILRR